jgi:nucleotide-binding universal stress UspA family protein
MTPVICVTEFSELTLQAARAAAAIARCWGEHVVVVRSVDEREQFAYALRSRLIHQDWRRLTQEARQLRQLGFDFEEKVLRGMPEDGIAAFAWKSGARLIVVGCNPTATVEHWALGCMAEEISETSLVPVLAVRSAEPIERWLGGDSTLKVFVAIDPAARPDAMLNRLDELQQMSACRIQAALVSYPETNAAPSPSNPAAGLHPFDLDRDFRSLMTNELAAREMRSDGAKRSGDIGSALVDAAVNAGADLLVVTSHPRTDLTLLPHRTLSHEILRRASMSVLCVPEPAIDPPHQAVSARSEPSREPPAWPGRNRHNHFNQ